MDASDLRSRIGKLRVWRQGDRRAPHKPLLLLYNLGRVSRGEPREVPFEQVEDELGRLLEEFGPPNPTQAMYPFWHLTTDGLWELTNAESLGEPGTGTPRKGDLLRHHVAGRFPDDVQSLLVEDPRLRAELARDLLETNFPESLHDEILEAVGLSLASAATQRTPRDPKFRTAVLRAYEFACAVCGYDVRVGSALAGLEAAHIKWHQAGGPDIQSNGLALCSLHHKLFDLGAYTVEADRRIVLSEHASGGAGFERQLLDFHGERVRPPQSPDYEPAEEFVEWHREEVFRGPGRWLGTSAEG